MKKILHLINNDNDGIYHFVDKLTNSSLKNHENFIIAKYAKSKKNIITLDSGKSLTEFIKQPKLIIKNINEFLLKLFYKIKRDFYNFLFKPKSLFNFYFNDIDFHKLTSRIKKADILIIYTFREVISPRNLKKIQQFYNCKIIFYPLDYELLSGGFHFNNLDNENKKLLKKNIKLINFKIKHFSNLKIHWIAVNKYVEKKIINSKIFDTKFHRVSVIYNFLQNFKFSEKEIVDFKVKNKLNNYRVILLFSGLKLSDNRKGLSQLKKCIHNYKNFNKDTNKIALVTLGKEKNFELKNNIIDHIHFEYISDYRELNLLFRSCNVFLNFSKSDFGPVLSEIAFVNDLFILSSNVGIANEIVIDNANGFIYGNSLDCNNKFEKILELSIKKNKSIQDQQQIIMKKIYSLNKSVNFSKVFDD